MSRRMQQMAEAWAGREPRERVLLAVLAAVVAGLVYWYGLYSPLAALAESERERHEAASAGLARARGLSAAIQSRASTGGGAPPEQAVRRSAEEAGIAVSAVEPEGDALAVSIEAVAARPLFAWLARLQDEDVGVRNFEAHRVEDGMVQVRLVLTGSGR
jgi:general secretion pathway protein M